MLTLGLSWHRLEQRGLAPVCDCAWSTTVFYCSLLAWRDWPMATAEWTQGAVATIVFTIRFSLFWTVLAFLRKFLDLLSMGFLVRLGSPHSVQLVNTWHVPDPRLKTKTVLAFKDHNSGDESRYNHWFPWLGICWHCFNHFASRNWI